jgi:signal transduction histidine kinase/HAMP domain-containing protein
VRFAASIGTAIFGAFVAMVLLIAALGGYGLYVLQAAGGFVVEVYDRPLMAINYGRAASLDFAEMDKEVLRRGAATSDRERAAIDAKIEHLAKLFNDDLAVAAGRSRYDDEQAALGQIHDLVARWNQLRREPWAIYDRDLAPLAAKIMERFDVLAELATGHSFVQRRRVVSDVAFFQYTSAGALLLALLLAAGITLVLGRRIIRPLREAATIADRIAAGELQAPIPEAGNDETGMLLRSMTVMQQNIRDMVEREQAQRRSAQNRLIEALENSREAVVLVDAADRIVIANSQLANFFPSLAPQLESGMNFTAAFRQMEQLAGAAVTDEAAETGVGSGQSPLERELRLADGRWLRISRSPLEEGGFFLVISDFSDVKEREERLTDARRQAEAASAAKTTFLANMSHELRTPLNAIIGFSEVMAGEVLGELNPTYLQYARDIRQSGGHLLDIISSVLDLSKSEAGKLKLTYQAVDLSEIIRTSVTMMREQCSRAKQTLFAVLPPEPIDAQGDPAKLCQVVLNLLSNAAKFTEAGGTITVSAAATGGAAVIRVTDNGIGMAPEEIPIALAAFGQIDSRLARRYEGTGLGLPLSKAIIELHGGTVTIDSAPGKGTCVTVTLPRQAVDAGAAAA